MKDERTSRKLMRIASAMLLDQAGVPKSLCDHECKPKRIPVRWWRWMFQRIVDSEDRRRQWAAEINKIAKAVRRLEDGAGRPGSNMKQERRMGGTNKDKERAAKDLQTYLDNKHGVAMGEFMLVGVGADGLIVYSIRGCKDVDKWMGYTVTYKQCGKR